MRKKIFRFTLVPLLFLSSFFIFSSSSKLPENSYPNTIQGASNDISSINELIKDGLFEINQYFAGSYKNENNEYIFCYTDKLDQVKAYIAFPIGTYTHVNYSVNQLNETSEAFLGILGQYEIQSVGISYSKNAVIVTLINFDYLEDIKAIVNCDSVIFQQAPLGLITVFN